MALDCPVSICDRPMPGSLRICGACSAELSRELQAVPDLWADLDLAISRQTRITSGGVGGRSPEKPLPWNERASEAADHLAALLIGWARVLVASVHVLQGPTCRDCSHPSCLYIDLKREPHHHPAAVAPWLRRHAGALVAHPAGPDAVEEILLAVRNARYVVDSPPRDLIYAGPCDACQGDLYARPDAVTVACRWCVDDEGQRLRYDVNDRRKWLLRRAEDLLAPAVKVSGLARMLGVKVGDSTVYEWAKKGLILTRGQDERGRTLYRLGDVVDVAMNTKQATRKAS